ESVLRELRRLIETGASPAWVTAADEESTRRPFGNGEAIFLRSWPYAADLFERPGSPVRGKVGLAPLPRDDPRRPPPGSTGGAHLAVTGQTRPPAEAFALARFLASAPAQRAMTASGATKPTIMTLYHDPELVRLSPSLPRIHDLTLAGRSRPVTPYYVMISTNLQPGLSAALAERSRLPAPPRFLPPGCRRVTADRRSWHGLLLLAPALVTLGALTLYPTVRVLWLSLQRRVPIFDVHRFEGIGNYLFLATDPRF